MDDLHVSFADVAVFLMVSAQQFKFTCPLPTISIFILSMYFVYVLKNPNGLLYKGQTENLEKRVEQHNVNDGFPAYTKGRGPWKLVYQESFETRSEAKLREKYLKSSRGRTFLRNILAQDL